MLRLAGRLAMVVSGLTLFACGVTMNIQAGVGLGPWWALHYGVTLYTPLSIGQASMVFGVLMVGASLLLRVRPGPATLMNIFLAGFMTDLLLGWKLVPAGSGGLDSYVLLALGVIVVGLGTAIYVKAGLGAGPRDSFMLGLAALLSGRVGLARNAMDIGVTSLGWLMGAPIGLGTIVFALGTGPAVAFWFKRLRVSVQRRQTLTARPSASSTRTY